MGILLLKFILLFCLSASATTLRVSSLVELFEALRPSRSTPDEHIELARVRYACDDDASGSTSCYESMMNSNDYHEYREMDNDMLVFWGEGVTLQCFGVFGSLDNVDDDHSDIDHDVGSSCVLDGESNRRILKIYYNENIPNNNNLDVTTSVIRLISLHFLNGYNRIWDGGSIWLSDPNVDLIITSCVFQNSFATRWGGAIYVKRAKSFEVFGTSFIDNNIDDGHASAAGRDVFVENELSSILIGKYLYGCGDGFYESSASDTVNNEITKQVQLSNGIDNLSIDQPPTNCRPCSDFKNGYSTGEASIVGTCSVCVKNLYPNKFYDGCGAFLVCEEEDEFSAPNSRTCTECNGVLAHTKFFLSMAMLMFTFWFVITKGCRGNKFKMFFVLNAVEVSQFVWILTQLKSSVWEYVGEAQGIFFSVPFYALKCLWEMDFAGFYILYLYVGICLGLFFHQCSANFVPEGVTRVMMARQKGEAKFRHRVTVVIWFVPTIVMSMAMLDCSLDSTGEVYRLLADPTIVCSATSEEEDDSLSWYTFASNSSYVVLFVGHIFVMTFLLKRNDSTRLVPEDSEEGIKLETTFYHGNNNLDFDFWKYKVRLIFAWIVYANHVAAITSTTAAILIIIVKIIYVGVFEKSAPLAFIPRGSDMSKNLLADIERLTNAFIVFVGLFFAIGDAIEHHGSVGVSILCFELIYFSAGIFFYRKYVGMAETFAPPVVAINETGIFPVNEEGVELHAVAQVAQVEIQATIVEIPSELEATS